MIRKRIRWSANLAYAVGLIATDGCLSKDGRHIILVSKDTEQLENFARCLELKNKIAAHSSSYSPERKYYRTQFGNVRFYRFLLKIGLTPNKTKSIHQLLVPDKFFCDFLRGSLDGDGSTYSYFDPRWKNSFMLYTSFVSASKIHVEWLNYKINELYGFSGKIGMGKSVYQLKFAKWDSVKLLSQVYYKDDLICLSRKRSKINEALGIITKQAGVMKR